MRLPLVLFLAAALLACQGRPARDEGAALRPEGPVWRPRPVAMRVYPSTRFVNQGPDAMLEARIELSDEMGDPIKGAGEFRLELFGGEPPRQLYAWRVPAYTLEQQRSFYDPITRTYLMRLKLDPAATNEPSPTLGVLFTPAAGSRLQAEAPIRTTP